MAPFHGDQTSTATQSCGLEEVCVWGRGQVSGAGQGLGKDCRTQPQPTRGSQAPPLEGPAERSRWSARPALGLRPTVFLTGANPAPCVCALYTCVCLRLALHVQRALCFQTLFPQVGARWGVLSLPDTLASVTSSACLHEQGIFGTDTDSEAHHKNHIKIGDKTSERSFQKTAHRV